jgi:hypothetical protein
MISSTMMRNAVAPDAADCEPSGPKSISGTKITTENGPVFDHRPVSQTIRNSRVLTTSRRSDHRHTESTHQPSANIMMAGVSAPVERVSTVEVFKGKSLAGNSITKEAASRARCTNGRTMTNSPPSPASNIQPWCQSRAIPVIRRFSDC